MEDANVPSYILVTGATGFIGAHVVDALLNRGLKVRGATRSKAKGEAMLKARPKHASHLDFVVVEDFETGGSFENVMTGIDGVIHVASVSQLRLHRYLLTSTAFHI
jgi:nucleoside-diphosphate-sugar epimerase